MNFNVKFNFENGQVFDAEISSDQLTRFLKTISKSEVYWDEIGGFWIAFTKILYFTVREIKTHEVEPKVSTDQTDAALVEEPKNSEDRES